MSPAGLPEPELNGELARAREQELEVKAAQYAARHPDDAEEDGPVRPPGPVARLLRILRGRRG